MSEWRLITYEEWQKALRQEKVITPRPKAPPAASAPQSEDFDDTLAYLRGLWKHLQGLERGEEMGKAFLMAGGDAFELCEDDPFADWQEEEDCERITELTALLHEMVHEGATLRDDDPHPAWVKSERELDRLVPGDRKDPKVEMARQLCLHNNYRVPPFDVVIRNLAFIAEVENERKPEVIRKRIKEEKKRQERETLLELCEPSFKKITK